MFQTRRNARRIIAVCFVITFGLLSGSSFTLAAEPAQAEHNDSPPDDTLATRLTIRPLGSFTDLKKVAVYSLPKKFHLTPAKQIDFGRGKGIESQKLQAKQETAASPMAAGPTIIVTLQPTETDWDIALVENKSLGITNDQLNELANANNVVIFFPPENYTFVEFETKVPAWLFAWGEDGKAIGMFRNRQAPQTKWTLIVPVKGQTIDLAVIAQSTHEENQPAIFNAAEQIIDRPLTVDAARQFLEMAGTLYAKPGPKLMRWLDQMADRKIPMIDCRSHLMPPYPNRFKFELTDDTDAFLKRHMAYEAGVLFWRHHDFTTDKRLTGWLCGEQDGTPVMKLIDSYHRWPPDIIGAWTKALPTWKTDAVAAPLRQLQSMDETAFYHLLIDMADVPSWDVQNFLDLLCTNDDGLAGYHDRIVAKMRSIKNPAVFRRLAMRRFARSAPELYPEAQFQQLLEEYPGLEPSDKPVLSIFRIACITGNLDLFKTLRRFGVTDALLAEHRQGPALPVIVEGKQVALAEYCLQQGGDPNQSSPSGLAPLMQAVASQSPEMIQLLLKYKANPNVGSSHRGSALDIAIEKDDPAMVQLLLDAGADIRMRYKNERQLLVSTARSGAVAEALLKADAPMNAADENQRDAIYLAAQTGRTDVVQVLARHGADLEGHATQYTPLYAAIMSQKYETAAKLIELGAKPAVSPEGYQFLVHDVKLLTAFLDAGLAVDSFDSTRGTLLAQAVSKQELDSVAVLLNRGANPNYKPGAEKHASRVPPSALEIARRYSDRNPQAAKIKKLVLEAAEKYPDPQTVQP